MVGFPPIHFWAFLSDAPRNHLQGHQEGGLGTDRFPHSRAVASFSLTSLGNQPRMGAGDPGALVLMSSSTAPGLRPETDLPTGTLPTGSHGSHKQVLSTNSFVCASQQGWEGPFTGGWGASCRGKQPPERGLVFLVSPRPPFT